MLRRRLIDWIVTEGPITFDDFMRACLYDPDGGFFTAGPVRSAADGDFLTSPEVSPLFGATLASFVTAERSRLDVDSLTIVDVGAGSGSLLGALRAELADGRDRIVAVDASPAARRRLADQFDTVLPSIYDLPDIAPAVVIGNELLDNIPAALAKRAHGQWVELRVGVEDGRLVWVETEARSRVVEWADRYGGDFSDGALVEVQVEAQQWIRTALSKLRRGSLLLFDYGGETEELMPRRQRGTLRTYRAHHLGPDPLDAPGETDVTVDVDFSAARDTAESCGFVTVVERQDDFLARHGLRDRLASMRQAELDLARSGDSLGRLALRSDINNAETLLHPRGLGDFRVLVARSPDQASADGGDTAGFAQ